MTAKKTKQEYTYFIQQETGGNIKIGFTTQDPEARLKNLQTGSAYTLQIVGLLEGNREERLHKKFSDVRVKGEWFKNSEELVHYIKSNTLEGYNEPLVSSPKIDEQGYLKYEITKQVWGVSPSVADTQRVEFDWCFSKNQQGDDDGFFGLEEQMCDLGQEHNIINQMGFQDLTWSEDQCWDMSEDEFYDRDKLSEPLCEFDVFRNMCYTIEKYTDYRDDFGRKIDFFKDVYINSDEWVFMATCKPITSNTRAKYINDLANVAWDMDEFCAFHFFAYDDVNDRLYDLNRIAMNNFFNKVSGASGKSIYSDTIHMSDLYKFLKRRANAEGVDK